MFFRLPRLTPGYIRFLQTQAYQNVSPNPPGEKAVPRLAVLMGALGIGMCGYSARQLSLHHRPSARVLMWASVHSEASAAAQRTPFVDVTRRPSACREVPPLSFAGEKVSAK